MREVWEAAGVPVPRFRRVSSLDDLRAAAAELTTPLLLKVAGSGGSKEGDDANQEAMWSFINSIGGGTDQIQRNIISERILGLPKGYEPDRGVPFRDVRKGGSTGPDGK